jgi:hypothetical protein
MSTNSVEAKIHKSGAKSTSLVIRAQQVVIQTEFGETTTCEFPIWGSAPVPVEIPPGGAKSFIVGPLSGVMCAKGKSGDFPNIVKFPVYREQGIASMKDYDAAGSGNDNQILVKTPFMSLATVVSGVVDNKLVETHCVLPIWNDGSTVLVQLDWIEGEPSEGTPNPEWHLTASKGLPIELGFAGLEQASQLPSNARRSRYQLHLTPWLLGAEILGDKGQRIQHPVWQREWRFDGKDEFVSVLGRLCRGLTGRDIANSKDVA